jgi:hypothetical protein
MAHIHKVYITIYESLNAAGIRDAAGQTFSRNVIATELMQ